MTERPDLWRIADGIQMDLRAAQAKLVELRGQLAGLDLPDPASLRCDVCGVKVRGPRTLAEHAYVSHGGPLPAHWREADELADSGVTKSASDIEQDIIGMFKPNRPEG